MEGLTNKNKKLLEYAGLAALESYHDVMFANGRQTISVQDSREFIDELKKEIELRGLLRDSLD